MKEHCYIVAQNAFSVSVPEDLEAWKQIEPRFRPFAAEPAGDMVLEVGIKKGRLPECASERIYEPVANDISFITGHVGRFADGSLEMVHMHVDERKPRLWMKMPPTFDKAEIVIDPEGDGNDHYFLTHALMVAFTLAVYRTGTLMIHSSSVVYDGKAYLFQGKSGTGKSTHASLWVKNIAGAELLNDDNPLIRFAPDGAAMAYGSPWSGKTDCYRNAAAPIGAFVRIVRSDENYLRRLAPLNAYASLTASVAYLPFITYEMREARHMALERLAATVPCCEMHCRPDADAAFACMRGLTNN